MKIKREQLKIDPQKCTACHRCEIACAMKHHGRVNPDLSRIKILRLNDQELNVPVICMACEAAPCISVCPMNARVRASNGTVVTDTDACIGCRACMYICPVCGPAVDPHTGQTMTCDMCEGDESGPWCVTACTPQGALTISEQDSMTTQTVRAQAGRMRKIYS